jgi:hypothetical protein
MYDTATSSQSTRRQFLKGVGGAVLALPLLESQLNAAEIAKPPRRLVASGVFFGLLPQYFHPQEVGPDYRPPRLLKPLETHRDQFTVFSGLDHNIGGGHTGTKYFLSGIPIEHSKGYPEANISIDQKAAAAVGAATRFPSLVLGCETNVENHISWTRNGAQARPVTQIRRLQDMLFRNPSRGQIADSRRDLVSRRSILDLVRDQAKTFQTGISTSDQEKLDQYFTSVRELEQKIAQSEQWLDSKKPDTDFQAPNGIDTLTLREKTPFFYDLMALALQTDSTRVITLSFSQLGRDNGGFPAVSHGYHSLSHHGKVESAIEELSIIESFFTSQFGRFLDTLSAIKEPNGQTLLDNTMALFGSGMSNANSHSNRDLPVLLAGGGFRHGSHRHYARNGRKSVPLCNLYLSMLQHFGLEIDGFNTSSGTLSGLELA